MLDLGDDPGSFDRSAADEVRRAATDWIRGRHIGFAYGSLAAGGDLVVAEAMVESGADLHVVLPFDVESFLDASVRPAGDDWERRFSACLESATSVTVTSDSAYLGHDELFAFASQVAMGRAVIRANALASEVTQLAVWDGEPQSGPAGTAPGRGPVEVERPVHFGAHGVAAGTDRPGRTRRPGAVLATGAGPALR